MDFKIYDICIIGAGASGLVAAIESSRRGLSCVVVDKNKKPGTKLYATGNGRCNMTNDTWDEESYYDNEFPMQTFDSIYKLTGMRQRSFITNYFKNLGISTINKDGYIYPASLQASSVVWCLVEALRSFGAELKMNSQATDISRCSELSGAYRVRIDCKRDGEAFTDYIYARNIVISTGGLSGNKLGVATEDVQYNLFQSLRVPFDEFKSGLCPVICNEDITYISGVRSKVRLSVDEHHENGEIQFTDNGISGIVTFNMSYYMKAGSEVIISFLPKVSEDDFLQHFIKIKEIFPDKRLDSFINGYINDKLATFMIQRFYGNPEFKLCLKDITETGIRGLYQELNEFKLTIRNKESFHKSQASIGGILTQYIDPYTMKINSNVTLGDGIYAVGEATDVIGKCGGYNLTYAFITGYLAGNSVR